MRIGSRDSFALVWLIVATFGIIDYEYQRYCYP